MTSRRRKNPVPEPGATAARRAATVLVAATWLPPAAVTAVMVIVRPDDFPAMLAVGCGIAAIAMWLAVRHVPGRGLGVVLAVTTAALLVLWPEIALRIAGFRYDGRAVVQFGYPRPEMLVQLEPDPELFWRWPDTEAGVNADGFMDRPFEIPKPPGTYRILFLGDSCTQQGYPNGVEAYLGPDVDAVNLGIMGYTSYQGTVVARRWADRLEPDAAVVYFGWNDHWLAFGETDADKAARPGGFDPGMRGPAKWSRLAQWIVKRTASGRSRPTGDFRVPITAYGDNLATIGDRLAAAGAEVFLVTAPTAHESAGVPDYIVAMGYAADKESARRAHREYNEVVRRIAAERDWRLIDLEAEAERLPDPRAYFLDDGIHFSPDGARWVARRVADAIAGARPRGSIPRGPANGDRTTD